MLLVIILFQIERAIVDIMFILIDCFALCSVFKTC